MRFNTQPPEGGCQISADGSGNMTFQHTAARRRLSWLKTAAQICTGFNTQPPEGGWYWIPTVILPHGFQHTAARRRLRRLADFGVAIAGFNTQPPEGGCYLTLFDGDLSWVSTHSRPKAAECFRRFAMLDSGFQHTAARRRLSIVIYFLLL